MWLLIQTTLIQCECIVHIPSVASSVTVMRTFYLPLFWVRNWIKFAQYACSSCNVQRALRPRHCNYQKLLKIRHPFPSQWQKRIEQMLRPFFNSLYLCRCLCFQKFGKSIKSNSMHLANRKGSFLLFLMSVSSLGFFDNCNIFPTEWNS